MKNILYISLVDWFWIKQRPHHFVEGMAKENKVSYFCMQAWRRNSNTVVTNSEENKLINLSKIKKGNITIVRKKVIPLYRKFKFLNNLNDCTMTNELKKMEIKNNFDIVVLTHPMQLKYVPIEVIRNKTVVYDCMDDYEEFNYYDKNELLKYEEKIFVIANKIVCSSNKLKDKLIDKYGNNKEIKVVNNGVDILNFDINRNDKNGNITFFDIKDKKRVGYIGAISEWFDFELIANVAKRNPKVTFYIIGPIEKGLDIKEFSNIENIKVVGSISYEDVPKVLQKIDVAIMPFKLNELIKAVNPVKIYEYLAMGKNVLAIRYKETEKFEEYIELYENEEEFERKLLGLLSETQNVNKKIEYARQNSWQSRVKSFYDFIV